VVRYLLDATFVIDYLRGFPDAIERFGRFFEEGDQPIVNEVVVCEVAAGSRRHPDPDLLAMLEPIEFAQPGPDHAVLAGQWRAEARARGRTLNIADALIAAAADASDAVVMTRNLRDFALTPVRVEAY
jgi:predicted nucleic acid-binding protein